MRIEVAAFAPEMARRLDENDHKEGWGDLDKVTRSLWTSVDDKFDELADAIREYDSAVVAKEFVKERREDVLNAAADLANYALIVADVCKATPPHRPTDVDISNIRMQKALGAARGVINAHVRTSLVEGNVVLQEIEDVIARAPESPARLAKWLLESLSEDERVEVMESFCAQCGAAERDCPCLKNGKES